MSLNPATYAEALKRAQERPKKPRTPLRPRSTLKTSPARRSAPKKKRKKKLTTGQLKKKAWKEFSVFIRTRGADSEGFNTCVTCKQKFFWKDLQAGHFIRGRLNANLFDDRGCAAQCLRCNIHLQGNVVVYYGVMLEWYGQATIDELLQQNNQTHKWAAGELQSIWERYKALNAANPLLRDEG